MHLASLTMPVGSEWLAVLIGYLLGSIPFGFLLARLKGIDLRAIGSGNIGATNTGRALGKPLGFLAFFLDFTKGWFPAAVVASWFLTEGNADSGNLSLAVLAGGAAVIGHVWPVYLGFKGGKAVATGCGVLVALDPTIFVLGGAVFLITAFSTGFVSLGSIAMGLSFPIIAWQVMGDEYGGEVVVFCVAFAVLVVLRHKDNLKRLTGGLEPRWRGRSKD
ncbi:MAG: glycerol-3-phosphate 1-O-acyltransferase PlsY [Planctomycetota bacterium]|nr:glycerol-3-phosphate 1-O-acyltransferase PlsY [Planctomycetota bacterium]